MTRPTWLAAGLGLLALLWVAPWHAFAPGSFTVHMLVHVGIVAIAAPLIALGLAGGRFDPVRRAPRWLPPIQLSIVELVVVWAWHAPALHHAARHSALLSALEQGSFLACGLLLWIAVFGGDPEQHRERRAAGLVALLLTFMHMTLLGALLALSPRALYPHAGAHGDGGLADQHIGGAIMLLVGGVGYLAGALWLAVDVLRERRTELP